MFTTSTNETFIQYYKMLNHSLQNLKKTTSKKCLPGSVSALYVFRKLFCSHNDIFNKLVIVKRELITVLNKHEFSYNKNIVLKITFT